MGAELEADEEVDHGHAVRDHVPEDRRTPGSPGNTPAHADAFRLRAPRPDKAA